MEGIGRLIDTFGSETDGDRRALRRAVIVRLLATELTRSTNFITAQLSRLEDA